MERPNLKKLFGKYLDADEQIRTDDNSACKSVKSERLVIAVSTSASAQLRFTDDLYTHISNIISRGSLLLADALYPVPILSIEKEAINETQLKSIIAEITTHQNSYRIVCGIDLVSFGTVGKENLLAYGSTGAIISSLIEGIITLPVECSWGDMAVRNLLGVDSDAPIYISNTAFYRLN